MLLSLLLLQPAVIGAIATSVLFVVVAAVAVIRVDGDSFFYKCEASFSKAHRRCRFDKLASDMRKVTKARKCFFAKGIGKFKSSIIYCFRVPRYSSEWGWHKQYT